MNIFTRTARYMPKKFGSYEFFISYEQEGSAGWSVFLYDRLRERFGDSRVFRDKQETGAGYKWKPGLVKRVANCRGFILMIGRDWTEERVLKKLRDPKSWVRREILAALEHAKPIFPVLVGGAVAPALDKLPQEIRPALADYNHFHFHDGPSLRHDLDLLCSDLEANTGVVPSGPATLPAITNFDQLICRLNRNTAANYVAQQIAGGHRLFLVCGSRKAGFHHFAVRCGFDVLGEAGARVVSLNWGRFCDTENPLERRKSLLKEIAENLLTVPGGGAETQRAACIKRMMSRSLRPTVLYSTVNRERGVNQAQIHEWFGIWRDLLAEDASHTNTVLLFVESGWGPWHQRAVKRVKQCDSLICPSLGRVNRGHFDEWLGADVRNKVPSERLRHDITRTRDALFRLRVARHFEEIRTAIADLWTAAAE